MNKIWQIRNVPDDTIQTIKSYAKNNHMSVAGAIVVLAKKLGK